MRMYVENKVPMVFLFLIATLFEVLLVVSLFCCCSWKNISEKYVDRYFILKKKKKNEFVSTLKL